MDRFLILLLPVFIMIASIFISRKRANRLLPKESAKSTLLREMRFAAIAVSGLGIVLLLYFLYSLVPTVYNLYDQFNKARPLLLETVPYVVFLGMLTLLALALYVLFSKSFEEEFDKKLQGYKAGEKVRVGELYTRKNVIFILLPGSPAFILSIFFLLPVYVFLWNIQQEYTTQPLSGEYTVPGVVTNIDASQMIVDGDGIVTLDTAWGEVRIAIPSGERVCAADTSDFDNLQIGDRVKVAGQFVDGKATICESPRHYFLKLLMPTDDPAANDIEGWQTYRNEEYGFEVKYPNQFMFFPRTERSFDITNYDKFDPKFQRGNINGLSIFFAVDSGSYKSKQEALATIETEDELGKRTFVEEFPEDFYGRIQYVYFRNSRWTSGSGTLLSGVFMPSHAIYDPYTGRFAIFQIQDPSGEFNKVTQEILSTFRFTP